jgi:hypothetical protein
MIQAFRWAADATDTVVAAGLRAKRGNPSSAPGEKAIITGYFERAREDSNL